MRLPQCRLSQLALWQISESIEKINQGLIGMQKTQKKQGIEKIKPRLDWDAKETHEKQQERRELKTKQKHYYYYYYYYCFKYLRLLHIFINRFTKGKNIKR